MIQYEKIDSVCTYCGVGCEITAHIENDKVVKIVPKEGGISNGGRLCIKGKEGYSFLYSPFRLKKHLIKKSFMQKNAYMFANLDLSPLQEESATHYSAPLELATKIAATKIAQINGEQIAFVGGARTNCESAWYFQHFARDIINSPHVDNCARVCHSPSLAGLKEAIGEGAATVPFDDILEAEFLLVIGSNTSEAHPIVANRITDAVKKGVTLAVVDIREIELSKKANFHLSLPPEANLLFLNALAKVIVQEKLYDRDFLKHRVSNFEEYKKEVLHDKLNDPSIFLKLKGYENLAPKIKEIARIYAKSRSLILWGLGITEHLDGSKATAAIANLALLTGNVGKMGAGLMPLRGQNNVQGACDMGCLPYFAPGYSKTEKDGLKTPQMIDAAINGELKAMWITGEDISHIHANLHKIDIALEKLDLLIVQEVMNCDISQKADILFAVKSAYEKDGVYINAERRMHISAPISYSDLPDDWEVLQQTAKHLGVKKIYTTTNDVWDDARKQTKLHIGASYDKLRQKAMQWPIAEEETARLYLKTFRTPNGLGKLVYNAYSPRGFVLALLNNEKPKLTLSTGRTISQYNNASQTRWSEKLNKHYSSDIILVNHNTAKTLDFTKKYILKSIYGQSAPLIVKEDKRLPSNILYTTFHFKESKINNVFGDECDATTMTPRFKAIEVELLPSP